MCEQFHRGFRAISQLRLQRHFWKLFALVVLEVESKTVKLKRFFKPLMAVVSFFLSLCPIFC